MSCISFYLSCSLILASSSIIVVSVLCLIDLWTTLTYGLRAELDLRLGRLTLVDLTERLLCLFLRRNITSADGW